MELSTLEGCHNLHYNRCYIHSSVIGNELSTCKRTIKPIAIAWEKQKQFVADASHELKPLLIVIAANTDVVLANEDDLVKNQSKWLMYIKEETNRMSKIVTNLCILQSLMLITRNLFLKNQSWASYFRSMLGV